MSRLIFLTLLLFSVFTLSAQESFVTIGSGGGVTGSATVYKIFRNGKIFKGRGVGEIKYDECAKLNRRDASANFIAVSRNTKELAPFNHPGNVYYFLTYYDKGVEQIITWGDGDHPVPDHVKTLYEKIQKQLVGLTYKPIK